MLRTDITDAIYKNIEVSSAYQKIIYYPLTVVTFDELTNPKALKTSLVYMVRSFLSCGINFKILHLHKFKPRNGESFDPYTGSSQNMMETWLAGLPGDMPKPILIYVPIESALGSLKGFALPEEKYGKPTGAPLHLVNIAWINSLLTPRDRLDMIVDRVIDFRSINYTTEAHELGHLFLRSGHVKGDFFSANTMADGEALFVSSQFTKQQCDYIRSHPISK